MAVSNAVGSNVFDILLCLGLPWFLQTAIVDGGKPVQVYSAGMFFFGTMICTIELSINILKYHFW